ncbi:MAG: nucleoside permease [Armatimonadetes bacterium]|nr:nucleoside permease [Armatimonadota bacterium]
MTDSVKKPEAAIGARLSVMMFLEFFVWGGWYVTVGNYMGENGLKDSIAWAYSLCPIAAIISPFFTGMVADRFFATERVLGVLQLLGGATLLAAPLAAQSGPTAFLACLLLHTLFFMPTLGLTNTLAFSHMNNPEKQFPMVRVFGTIGWIVANIVVSKMLHGDSTPVQFHVAGAAAVLLGLYSFSLPHTPAPSAGQKATLRDIAGLDSLALLKKPAFAVFVASSFLICIPLAFYYAFAPVFVKEIGFKDPAFNMSFGQMSEIFFMVVMPLCFARLGVKWMLLVGMAAWVLRYGLFAGAATTGMLPLVIGGIVLHGVCYDFFFVTGQIYVDNVASTKIRGQAQGFLVLVTQGVGMLIGAQVAGKLVAAYTVAEKINWTMVWGIPCVAAGVIMLVFAATFKSGDEQKPPEELAA